MKVPAAVAAVVVSVRSRHRDPLDDAYRAATLVLGVTVRDPRQPSFRTGCTPGGR